MQTRAFILSSEPNGEIDRAYGLLAKDLGVIEAFSRSVRKPTSKLAGHLEPPRLAWVELIESNRGWQIASALEEKNYRHVSASPALLKMTLQAGFLLKELVAVPYPDDAVWQLWNELTERAEVIQTDSPDVIRGLFAQFLIRLTSNLGFLPDPAACGSCGRPFDPKANIIFENEDALCADCAKSSGAGVVATPKLRAFIRRISAGEWLKEEEAANYGLWKISKHFSQIARRLMV